MYRRIGLLISLICLLSACGYRGALYIPAEKPAASESSQTTEQPQAPVEEGQ